MGLLEFANALSGAAVTGLQTHQQLQEQQAAKLRQAQQDSLERANLAMKLGDQKGLLGALQASGMNVDPTNYLQQQAQTRHDETSRRNAEQLAKLSGAVKAGTIDPTSAEHVYRAYDTAYRGATPLFSKPGPAQLTEAQRLAHEDRQAMMAITQGNHADTMALARARVGGAGRAPRLVADYQPDGSVQYVEAGAGVKVHPRPGGALILTDNGDGTSTAVPKVAGATVHNHPKVVAAKAFDELKARKVAAARVGAVLPEGPYSPTERTAIDASVKQQKAEHEASQRRASGQPSALQSLIQAMDEDRKSRQKGGK